MAALVPTLTTALLTQSAGIVAGEISRSKSRGNQDLALQQLQAKQNIQSRQAQANLALDRDKIALDAKNAQETRKQALRRAVSRQRANFGAQGIGSGAGSSQAVLLGLFEETEAQKQRRTELDNLRLNAIDQGVSQRKSLNVLQRTQLQERQNINQISAGRNIVSNLFGV